MSRYCYDHPACPLDLTTHPSELLLHLLDQGLHEFVTVPNQVLGVLKARLTLLSRGLKVP